MGFISHSPAIRKLGDISRIIAKSDIPLEPNKSIPCSQSNQCGNQVFLSCEDENSDTYYILSLSIEELDSDVKETNLKKVYEASSRAKFDAELIGINIFTIEYPHQMMGFVVKSGGGILLSDSWHLLFLGGDELGDDCFSPESKIGNSFLCPLHIPSQHTLKYVSITNGSLWMHTQSEDVWTYILHDQPIRTCFLMNDCFGCVLLSMKSSFACKWDADRCISSPSSSPGKVFDCVKIVNVNFKNHSQEDDTWILAIKVTGVRLNNTFMGTHLSLMDRKRIEANKTESDEVKFILDYSDGEKVQNNPNETFLVINCSEFSATIELAIDGSGRNRNPDTSLTTMELLLIILIVMVTSLLLMLVTSFAFKSRLKGSLSHTSMELSGSERINGEDKTSESMSWDSGS